VTVSRNPKGIALFIRAMLFFFEKTRDQEYLHEAASLLAWLLQNTCPQQPELCWGYNYSWQNTIFLQKENEPNLVVTVFAGEAFLHAYRATGDVAYLDAANSAARFIAYRMPVLFENDEELAVAYVLNKVDAIVINNNALAGAFFTKLWKETHDDNYLNKAEKLLNYTVRRRTEVANHA
jgi:uncharacterized protein YyaL (SSP411 family)